MSNFLRIIYITTSSKDEAKRIGKKLVSNKLAACVNIIENMESMYLWNNEMVTDTESIIMAKTHQDKVKKLTDTVMELHSYDCPCIISLSINEQEGNESYLRWLKETLID